MSRSEAPARRAVPGRDACALAAPPAGISLAQPVEAQLRPCAPHQAQLRLRHGTCWPRYAPGPLLALHFVFAAYCTCLRP